MKLKLKNTTNEVVEVRLIPSTNAAAIETADDKSVVVQANRVVNIKLTEKEDDK